MPVEAPDGTAARPTAPSTSATSTSTVGLPRESRISRACTRVMFTMSRLCRVCRLSREAFLRSASAAIGLRFVAERFIAWRTDERLVVCRDDHHAALSDRVALPIFGGVVADEGAAGDQHVAIDDRAADARVPADPHAGHQDALIDLAETMN